MGLRLKVDLDLGYCPTDTVTKSNILSYVKYSITGLY